MRCNFHIAFRLKKNAIKIEIIYVRVSDYFVWHVNMGNIIFSAFHLTENNDINVFKLSSEIRIFTTSDYSFW
jgi:hypothetical protein